MSSGLEGAFLEVARGCIIDLMQSAGVVVPRRRGREAVLSVDLVRLPASMASF